MKVNLSVQVSDGNPSRKLEEIKSLKPPLTEILKHLVVQQVNLFKSLLEQNDLFPPTFCIGFSREKGFSFTNPVTLSQDIFKRYFETNFTVLQYFFL